MTKKHPIFWEDIRDFIGIVAVNFIDFVVISLFIAILGFFLYGLSQFFFGGESQNELRLDGFFAEDYCVGTSDTSLELAQCYKKWIDDFNKKQADENSN